MKVSFYLISKFFLFLPLYQGKSRLIIQVIAASGLYLLFVIRAHWTIENRLHWRRDVTLAEDASQVRKGSAPHALAVLNCFVLALFDFLGRAQVKQSMRNLDAQPLRAVQLLLSSLDKH
jgi:hypothetical protein